MFANIGEQKPQAPRQRARAAHTTIRARVPAECLGSSEASWSEIKRPEGLRQKWVPKGARFGVIRERMREIADDLGYRGYCSWDILAWEWSYELPLRRLEMDIRNRWADALAVEEITGAVELAMEELGGRGYPPLESSEEFYCCVLGATRMVWNFLRRYRPLINLEEVILQEEVYYALARDTGKGLQEGEIGGFREYASRHSMPELFPLILEDEDLQGYDTEDEDLFTEDEGYYTDASAESEYDSDGRYRRVVVPLHSRRSSSEDGNETEEERPFWARVQRQEEEYSSEYSLESEYWTDSETEIQWKVGEWRRYKNPPHYR